MAHFAKLGVGNVIEQIVVVHNSVITDNNGNEVEKLGVDYLNKIYNTRDTWKQYSYNKNFRGNAATVGGTYDQQRDAFIPPKPYNSWLLNETTLLWDPPIPYPDDGQYYLWNEQTVSWKKIDIALTQT
jgi:hypothetical protein